jgi:hypothetical protein
LKNVVASGLKVPMDEAAMPAELSALWIAKGRLIERNPNAQFLAIDGTDPVAHADDYARALLTAHGAFARAEDLQASVTAAAGCARTLLKLPRAAFDWKKHEAKLTELVERHRQDAAEDPSLLFADAAVLRRRAMLASGRLEGLRLAEQSLDRLSKVDGLTLANDPYVIRGLALCASSDTYLRAAFWTPIATSDEAKLPASGRTKYALLSSAIKAARSAETDPNLLLPEEAQIAKGNALEDLSFYCKEIDHYQEANDAFQAAVKKSGQWRPKAYALMCQGRCQYRWAMDSMRINVNPDERVKHLWEAYERLSDAQQHARQSDPNVEPEAMFWLATVRWESALQGPGNLDMPVDQGRGFRSSSLFALRRWLDDPSRKDAAIQEISERLRFIEQARQEIIRAADLARIRSAADWAKYLPTAVYLGKVLAENLPGPNSTVTPPVSPATLAEQVRTQVDRLLAFAVDEPGSLTPAERISLIAHLARVEQGRPGWTGQMQAQLYQDYEQAIAEQTDEARLQVVLIRLSRAGVINARDCADAEQIASRIASPSLRSSAAGYCQRFKGDELLRSLRERLLAFIGNPDTNKSLTLSDDGTLKAIQQYYADALQQLSKTSDPKTITNLSQLIDASADEIENGKWQQRLTNLEADALRQTIEETREIRKNLCDVLVARIYLHMDKDWPWKDLSKPMPDEEKQTINLAVACLKPARFCEVRFHVNLLEKDATKFLEACEQRK